MTKEQQSLQELGRTPEEMAARTAAIDAKLAADREAAKQESSRSVEPPVKIWESCPKCGHEDAELDS